MALDEIPRRAIDPRLEEVRAWLESQPAHALYAYAARNLEDVTIAPRRRKPALLEAADWLERCGDRASGL